MKIVLIGGTGLIGSKTAARLRDKGHEVLAASPKTGVNTITGEGLASALAGADVVVDLANAPSWEDQAVLDFFETSGRNLLAAERDAGVKHHIALSIVGSERLPENGYFRAKLAQERLIKGSPIPYTIIHSTQFMEFLKGIADEATVGTVARLSPAAFQPIASDDVADIVADVALARPVNGMIEIAGPERSRMNEIIGRYLKAIHDPRTVEADVHARYFGSELDDRSLVPDEGARLGKIGFADWFRQSQQSR
ncbi:SDR family oxidoreductase [Rhizobium sp. YAF28]|uniref:SDR family oxidoreductase n=1 Tax=Rhizobium sp. YAF28 TaxID=3233081 RepID=UPI003F9D5877